MLWLQNQASNYIYLCVRCKKKSLRRYKLWLSWKRCVILAWLSDTWVGQTCESVKQTTPIASAVTIWARSWSLSIYYSLKSSHIHNPPIFSAGAILRRVQNRSVPRYATRAKCECLKSVYSKQPQPSKTGVKITTIIMLLIIGLLDLDRTVFTTGMLLRQ